MDYIDAFRAAIVAAGLEAPNDIKADGERYRFSTNGKASDKSGWYRLHGDDRPAGSFGCWRTGFSAIWKHDVKREFTAEERAAWKKRMAEMEAQREAERKEAAEYAAKTAAQMWEAGREDAAHEYLARKKIPALGARVLKDMVLIPVKQSAGQMVGLQRIWPDGTKRPIKGTPMVGAYTVIGKAKDAPCVVICEGWATGVSIHMATQFCVVVAFNSGNLKPVADKITKLLPNARVVVAADDDAFTKRPDGTPWNPGLEAAMATGLPVYAPRWYGDRDGGTDFNDLHLAEGLKAVAECFAEPITPKPKPTRAQHQDLETARVSEESEPENTPEGPSQNPANNVEQAVAVVESSPVAQKQQPVPYFEAISRYGLECSEKGVPHATVANTLRILANDPTLAQTIWFDEFMDRVMTVWRGDKPREWSDVDDINLQIYLQESMNMNKLSKATVQDAVVVAAHMDKRNEAKAYIEGITWDGVERLPSFMRDIFGTDDTEYTRKAGENFWISMVARVVRPGCKVDTMIVLEGMQGAGKSKALSIIGGQWFAEATQSPSEKDFYLNLAGKMLIEIGEMDAFSRSEVTKVKQVITCQVDRYRAPYERRAADHPRRCVFAGTTNRNDWNKDETGARRFWPVYCKRVDHASLIANRDQYFAEALAKLNAGGNWWTMPEAETKAQQEARRDVDELEAELIHFLIGRNEVSVLEVMNDLMKLPIDRQDKSVQMRISKALRTIGFERPASASWKGGKLVRVWVRHTPVAQNSEGPF